MTGDSLYQDLLEAAPDAMVAVDENGLIVLVNAQTESLFGYGRDELIGQPVEMLVPEAARAAHRHHRAGYLVDPRTRPMGVGMELAGRRRDGREFPAEISLSAIRTDQGTWVSAAIRDGTERRQAAIVSSSRDAIMSQDLNGVITSWNRAAAELYGYPASEAIGRDLRLLVAPGHLDGERAARATAAGGAPVGEFETVHLRADGTEAHLACTISTITDTDGSIVGVSTFSRDISDRIRAQAERQALEDRLHQSERLESLGQLAGGVAHDFNNLLSVILNYASFVAEQIADDEAASADVEEIRLAAERAARLTHQLLLFGRRDTAQAELLDLNAVLADVQTLLARTLGEHVELVVHTPEVAPLLRADRGQIEQVLLNLAVNGRDAMPDGGFLTVEVSRADLDEAAAETRPGLAPGRYVMISVSDTGTGMSQSVIDHAFEPFYTTKPKGEGTGLGLATVYGVVSRAGGGATIYSEQGLGTTVRVYLPSAEEAAELVGAEAAPAPAPGTGETVLVVEDEAAIRRVTNRLLTRNGYRVLLAASGAEALELAATHHFDVLLTDVVMPGLSGPELADRIRHRRPEVRVLFMSGYSQGVLSPQQGLGEGAALMDKPFSERTLLDKLAALRASPGSAPGPSG